MIYINDKTDKADKTSKVDRKDKRIFIINGMGGCGKDSFVERIQEYMGEGRVRNFSSVDKVKQMAEFSGWGGAKTDKDRKYLSDLKALTDEYCDMSFKDIHRVVNEFYESNREVALFIHIRESWNISRAVAEFGANTILVRNNSVKDITTNKSDADVYNYEYDYIIDNNETLEDLTNKAIKFCKEHLFSINTLLERIETLETENESLRKRLGNKEEHDKRTGREVVDLESLSIFMCEELECTQCPIYTQGCDKRSRNEKENMYIPCCTNIIHWLTEQVDKMRTK